MPKSNSTTPLPSGKPTKLSPDFPLTAHPAGYWCKKIRGRIHYPRPKTGLLRRCPLWPETLQALKEALAKRPKPNLAEHAALVCITKYGQSWAKSESCGPLVLETRKLLKRLGINGRARIGFDTLRRTFRTVADEAKDQPAADYIMGHEVPHMSSVYRETISDERLKAITDQVRAWLFPPAKAGESLRGQ